MRRSLPIALTLLGASSACSSPADVRARFEFAQAEHANAAIDADEQLRQARAAYESEIARAEAWDQHFLSIPAAGWMPIVIVFGLLLFGALIWAIWLISQARENHRMQQKDVKFRQVEADKAVAIEREKTRQAIANRGACTTCGAQPLAGEDRAKLEESS